MEFAPNDLRRASRLFCSSSLERIDLTAGIKADCIALVGNLRDIGVYSAYLATIARLFFEWRLQYSGPNALTSGFFSGWLWGCYGSHKRQRINHKAISNVFFIRFCSRHGEVLGDGRSENCLFTSIDDYELVVVVKPFQVRQVGAEKLPPLTLNAH